MNLWSDPILGATATLMLASVLGGAAVHKLSDRMTFRETLRDYRVLPVTLVAPVATTLPYIEIAACALLLLPISRSIGAALVAGLLASYALAIGWNLARGRRDIDCGCSWVGSGQAISAWLVGRNVLLVAVAGIAAMAWDTRPADAGFGIADGLVVAAATVCALLFYHAAERLIANQTLVATLRRAS